MRKIFLVTMGIVLFSMAMAQHPGYKPVANLDAFKKDFTAAAQKIQTIKSDFLQEKNLSMLSDKIVSKGKFWFKKNDQVRMEYLQPFNYLMIMNQNAVYIKDGQKENKMSTRSNKLFQQINRITVDCIQGTALDNRDFSIAVFESAQGYLIEMTPVTRTLKEFFKNINININKKDYAVTKIDLVEPGGDNTAISFINRELNTNIPDILFAIK